MGAESTAHTAAPGEFEDFDEASEAVLAMMHALLSLDLWLLARVHDQSWTVLHSVGTGPVKRGDVVPFADTICNRMLRRLGPYIAPAINDVPAYAGAPFVQRHRTESYAGVPVVVNGDVFGVLCGMSADARAPAIVERTGHLITVARTFSTLLSRQLEAESLARRVERAENESMVDELTGLSNRRGWDRFVALEAARGRRYGHTYAVFMMDINGLKEMNDRHGHSAGDALIGRTADVIRGVMRENDVAARLGGDEFAILASETNDAGAAALHERLISAFVAAGVSVSVGYATAVATDIASAADVADARMYESKASR